MLHRYYAAVRLLVCSSTASSPRLPVAARDRQATAGQTRSPRFRRDPSIRDVASDPGRATVPRITAPHMLPSAVATASAPAISRISWLNPTPQTITVYASPWSSPSTTQHSLPGGRYPFPEPDFHRLDRASFAWRTSGRGADYSTPPPQIPACSFPAPGSRRRSNAIVGLDTTDPQARCFSDMLSPALSPEHASLLAFPSTGRLPSAISAADFSRLCSMLQRYYAAVRLLVCSSTALSPRLPVAARDRSSDCGPNEVSQVPTRSVRP